MFWNIHALIHRFQGKGLLVKKLQENYGSYFTACIHVKCLQCSEIITSALISCVNFTLCMLFVGKINHLFKKNHIFFLGEILGSYLPWHGPIILAHLESEFTVSLKHRGVRRLFKFLERGIGTSRVMNGNLLINLRFKFWLFILTELNELTCWFCAHFYTFI
jgi:hypothetical protein